MKLHAVHGERRMHEAHPKKIVSFCVHVQRRRHACPFNHERMIACCFYWAVDAMEDSCAGMPDLRYFAVNRRRPHNFAAESLPDGLVAKTDTEDRRGRRCFPYQL